MRIRFFLLGFALTWQYAAFAQLTFRQIYDVLVTQNQVSLKYPWVGGLNSPQINTIDIDGDGIEDLVIFDRMSFKVYTFRVTNQNFEYTPAWEQLFPTNLNYWLLLRDFNGDGRKDIFTGHWQGVVVFVNTTKTTGQLTWRNFNNGNPLQTIDFSMQPITLPLNLADIPVIADLDLDDDLDFLSPRLSGNATVEFNRNQQQELNLNNDSIQLIRVTRNWGNFEDCSCGNFAFEGAFCLSGGRVQHSGAKALFTYDVDHDGDHDLYYSDESCNNIYLLRNTGSSITPQFQSAEAILPETANFFPALFVDDIDSDGVDDFLVTSNFSERNSIPPDFSHSIWRYMADFTRLSNNFLQKDMLDVGDEAVPAFADEDGDGDLDMFIGNYVGPQGVGTIWLYENVGNAFNPEFSLKTTDFANLSSQQLVNIKPLFADVTGDGNTDLVFTATQALGQTAIHFLRNKAANRLTLNADIESIAFDLIWNEKVTFTDFNADGKVDILKGTFWGEIQCWINTGSLTFSQTNNLQYLGSNLGRTSPFLHVTDVDADSQEDLLISGAQGQLTLVRSYQTGTPAEETIQVVHESLGATRPQLGGRLFATTARLTGNVVPQIISGTIGGGLIWLQSENQPTSEFFDLYPNPVATSKTLFLRTSSTGSITFTTLKGQPVTVLIKKYSNGVYELDVTNLAPGAYLVQQQFATKRVVKRLIVSP